MTPEAFGTTADGRPVRRLVLGQEPGPVLHLLDLGATVHRLEVTGGDGVRRNVALGHPTGQDHLDSSDYLGSTVGRYANRIAGGRFSLDGREVVLGAHDRGNHLHGGPDGFDRRTWEVVAVDPSRAVLVLHSPDGDQGFPGELDVEVTVEVTEDAVRMDFVATTGAPTVVNLTNHSYFNLDGEGAGTIDDHVLTVHADAWTPVDDTGIPQGEPADVAGTPFDLREPTRLGGVVRSGHPQVVAARGLDHDFVLRGSGWRTAATLDSRASRTRLTLETDQPGLQVYTGNFLDGSRVSTSGGVYRQGDGIALEPQLPPDSPNHQDRPEGRAAILRPGETYRAALRWTFTSLG
jgi:aldose 1-epimerase